MAAGQKIATGFRHIGTVADIKQHWLTYQTTSNTRTHVIKKVK